MPSRPTEIVHREIIDLAGSPPLIRDFIMTPERILDYYPGAIEGAVIEPCKSFYCRGTAGTSLLELISDPADSDWLMLEVSTAMGIKPPYTAERIRKACFFSMIEDWQLAPHGSGTRLTKTWRNLNKFKLRFMPMAFIVRRTAVKESVVLQSAWNAAAKRQAGH